METVDALVARWSSWLVDDGPVSGTVHRLENDRDRWSLLREMVASNHAIPHPHDTLGWFWYHYSCDAAIRIRRLADKATNSASLARLLDEIAGQASSLTRQWYLDLWRRRVADDAAWDLFHRDCANDWFDQLACGQNDSLPAELVAADSSTLTEAVAPVKLFVDKRLAHHNPQYDPELSYAEVSTAIDLIGSLFRKYVRLVRQVDPLPLTDNTNWGAAFAVAWSPAT